MMVFTYTIWGSHNVGLKIMNGILYPLQLIVSKWKKIYILLEEIQLFIGEVNRKVLPKIS